MKIWVDKADLGKKAEPAWAVAWLPLFRLMQGRKICIVRRWKYRRKTSIHASFVIIFLVVWDRDLSFGGDNNDSTYACNFPKLVRCAGYKRE